MIRNIFSLLLLFSSVVHSQDSVSIKKYLLGNDTLTFHLTLYYPHSEALTFINLHDDENTSVEAGLDFLSRYGGALLQLQHGGKRIFNFSIDSLQYSFDPNRIFTENGVRATLEKRGSYSDAAASQVKNIADSILVNYVNDKKLVIALHNNTEKGLSILSYKKGGFEAENAAKIYFNRRTSPHDFILTTDETIFRHLIKHKINTVLQHPQPTDDGSLSVYAAKNNIAYINIEALHGHFNEQVKMLEAIKNIIFRY
jgi:hypothetical protein